MEAELGKGGATRKLRLQHDGRQPSPGRGGSASEASRGGV